MTDFSLYSVFPLIIVVFIDSILKYFGFIRPVPYIVVIVGWVFAFAWLMRVASLLSRRFSPLFATEVWLEWWGPVRVVRLWCSMCRFIIVYMWLILNFGGSLTSRCAECTIDLNRIRYAVLVDFQRMLLYANDAKWSFDLGLSLLNVGLSVAFNSFVFTARGGLSTKTLSFSSKSGVLRTPLS